MEAPGAAWAERGDFVFADLIGLDDEYVKAGMRIENPPPQELLVPLVSPIRAWPPATTATYEPLRTASYRPTNWHARIGVDMRLLPREWWTVTQDGLVGVALVRYRRTL